jgi:hypothetical protein
LVWNGFTEKKCRQEAPKANFGKRGGPMPVRRVVWAAATGKRLGSSDFIVRSCDTWGCVELACLACIKRKDVLAGRSLPLHQRAKLAELARARGLTDLTEEKAQVIREMSLSIEKTAKVMGVGETTVAEIRRGNRWVNYRNPFAGLARV